MRALTIATMLLCLGAVLTPAHARFARSLRSPGAPVATVDNLAMADKMAAKFEKRRGLRSGSPWAKGAWHRNDAGKRRADRAR